MRKFLAILLFLLMATPALGGSLEIKSTNRSGKTHTVVKKNYNTGQSTSSGSQSSTVQKESAETRGTAASDQDPAAALQAQQDEESGILLGTVKRMLQDVNDTMDKTEEAFKKDAAGGQ